MTDGTEQQQKPSARYADLEQAYCEERWTVVLNQGRTLLEDLQASQEADAEGVQPRVQLLLGHTYLYGFGDRPKALEFYEAVLAAEAEPSLHRIAEQGRDRCLESLEQPRSTPGAATAAAPWMEKGSSDQEKRPLEPVSPPPLVPDVIEEPELIEVHQNDPDLVEEVELVVVKKIPPAASELVPDMRANDLVRCLLRVAIG